MQIRQQAVVERTKFIRGEPAEFAAQTAFADLADARNDRDDGPDRDERRDDRDEDGRLARPMPDPLLEAERLRDDVGGGHREDRRREQARSEQADCEQHLREAAGEGLQRGRGVIGDVERLVVVHV